MKWSQDVMQVKYNLEQGDVWNHHITCLPVRPTPGNLGRNFWWSVYCSKSWWSVYFASAENRTS